MVTFLSLDIKGLVVALFFGLLIFVFGQGLQYGLGSWGAFFLVTLVYFLILSYIVTRIGGRTKTKLGLYEGERGWRNVVANGIVPLIFAFIFMLNSSTNYGSFLPQTAVIAAYVASVAAVTADKFASELGVLGEAPIMLLTLKKTERGASGGVSLFGLLMSAFAAFLISFVLLVFHVKVISVAAVTFAGFSGSLVDSVLGYYEGQGIGNKYTSNIACALSGALIALVLFAVL